jgi:hypothetical protein
MAPTIGYSFLVVSNFALVNFLCLLPSLNYLQTLPSKRIQWSMKLYSLTPPQQESNGWVRSQNALRSWVWE